MKRLLSAAIILVSVSLGAVAWTTAYFSDSETSFNNTFTAGDLDLVVSSQCHYWQNGIDVGCGTGPEFGDWELGNLGEVFKFFNFSDIKPGDYGENTIGLRVDTNDAWVCSDLTLTSSAENGITDPESEVDTEDDGQWDGELADNLQLLFWADDGDNVLELDEESTESAVPASMSSLAGADNVYSFALADSTTNLWTGIGGPVIGEETYNLGYAWCFGEFEINPLTPGDSYNASDNPGFTCDGASQTNITQTDIVTGDISFRAEQWRNNPDFVCGQDTSCLIEEETWANAWVEFNQGPNSGGGAVLASRSDPQTAVGPAEGTNAVGTFVSLGFGGSLTMEFEYPVEDVPGKDDLSFHEITNDPYPEESADIFVSQDGVTFEFIGSVSNVGDPLQFLDINGVYPWIKYVRVVDTTDVSVYTDIFDFTADGYDVDGLDAQNYNVCIGGEELQDF